MIQALIFTVIIQFLVAENTLWSIILAIIFGLLLASLANYDGLHGLFRKIKVTRETAHPSEWYAVFRENPRSYIILHYRDGRRLYGFPEKWPARPGSEDYFTIREPAWLDKESRKIKLESTKYILVGLSDIALIELLKIVTVETKL